ncbi:hypothetical protein BGX31_005123 [Mortierella sp. GBA43]|nr:hypothetical protein BGX31_005123 [Mortierella sp. GBA43]
MHAHSYYDQEDSSDESVTKFGQDALVPSISDAPQHTSTSQEVVPSSPGPDPVSTPSSSQEPSTQESATPALTQQPSESTSDASHTAHTTPKQSMEIDTASIVGQMTEDAKSLAITVENQDMMSRSDLEERLLRNLYCPIQSLKSESISVLHASANKHLPWTENPQYSDEIMRFIPQTRVFCINKQYRSVFMIDVSSSVLTVDSDGTKIVMSQVMETLSKCLTGLSKRFSCPGAEQDFVQTEVHITVIAECSQFASNSHTGLMLANFPTMKVLLQDVVLTETNLPRVLKVLRKQLERFQSRLSQFRGDLRRTRETLGYALAMEDRDNDINTELDLDDDISQRKTWGVGLSGANLSYTLTAGLFALGMMAECACPSLVVITDGVVKSNLLHGSTILRRLMELDVACSIVQLGNHNEAIPSSNWGFIRDTEALRFVAEATLGKFMYSQECIPVDPSTKSTRIAPNMYHRAFLIRELCLVKPRPGLDEFDDKDDQTGYSLSNFPWDPKSLPEPIKMMQTTCKDYQLNIPVEILVKARIRQGFRIKGVSVAPYAAAERYVITMTLTWLPNVTIQYRMKGQISNGGVLANCFSHFDSPKIEIDIIAYQAFAIHFLNTQHAPASANHSVYAKVFRLHRYIVGLSDSDVMLRGLNNSHASANQALWTQRTKSRERLHKSIVSDTFHEWTREEIVGYLSRLSDQWSGLARDADRQYSRGWYSEHEFDVLLVVPPPAFLPTNLDTKNSLVKYNEELESVVRGIQDILKETWASFIVGDVFIQTCQLPERTSSSTANTRFCELRLFSEPNVAVLRVQLRFFGVSLSQRRSAIIDLQQKIYNFQIMGAGPDGSSKAETETVQARIVRCRRPIHSLLMRHSIEPSATPAPDTALTDFQTRVTEAKGEESILRSYMVHKHWGWKDQVRDPAYLAENNYMASHDLAFQYLCAQRIGEGFLTVSALPDRVLFYKEVDLPEQERSLLQGSTAIQYLIFRSPDSSELLTELWMEPAVDTSKHNMFVKTKTQIIAVDRFILSRLATYEAIHTIGRLRLRPEVNSLPERGFMYPWLFDPGTLLRQQRLVTLAFEAPRRNPMAADEDFVAPEPPRRCIHTMALGTTGAADGVASTPGNRDFLLTKNPNTSTISLTQSLLETDAALSGENDLAIEYKDQLRELCCIDRDLAILHLFMEKSLSQLADGEIMPGGEDDACSQFFQDIRSSFKKDAEIRQTLMTFYCAQSFQDIRCFVKSVNARFFRLIIVPRLGTVIAHLTKLRSLPHKEHDNLSDRARQYYLSCLMFECLRSKHMTDISEYNANALEQSLDLFELHPVSLVPSVQQQPLLIQPTVNEDQGKAKVFESTLQLIRSISQAYSHSFAKAIYASLIEGHPVSSSDLKTACQICIRNSVDINITGFLNTLEQGRQDGTLLDESSPRSRFMDVLKHSFELAPVPESDQIYFYRPPLKKTGPKQAKPKTRKRSPSVSRSGSIDADVEDIIAEVIESAERPFFLHLECSFHKPLIPASELERAKLKSSVSFPVAELPVSYMYKEGKSREVNYAPSSIGLDTRPVDSADGTVAMLHLVISTLPTPDDYTPTLKTIDSETKISMDASQTLGPRNLQPLFPTLDATQVEAIADTEARLDWLVKEEVMHGLLDVPLVTIDILSLVETQLKTKSNFVNFPTAMTIPLTFVKKRRGPDIFMQELRRSKMLPYELHQVGHYFYLTEGDDGIQEEVLDDSTVNQSPVDGYADTFGESQNDDLPSLSGSFENDSSNDLCQGLGIVILPKPKPAKRRTSGHQNGQGSYKKKRSFWLILVPRDTFVQVYFFSKTLSEGACNALLDHVRDAIDELCIKVNQLTLLQSLNETRSCSKYLVPSDDMDPNSDSDSDFDSDSDQLSQEEDAALVTGGSKPADDGHAAQKKFAPGEFACPLVYRVAWPIHRRVKPGQAIKDVAVLVLFPFAVNNRKNFFVVESEDDYDKTRKNVVFLRLNEVEAAHTEQELSTPASEEAAPLSAQTLEDLGSHSNSPRPSPTASPGSRTVVPPLTRTDTRELVIEVYGVEPPGRKVTVDLFNLLENKFYNSVVLPVVSTFLTRSLTSKLTQADVDFILPIDRMAPVRQVLEIPQFINVPFAFLMYLKQNLCLYLNPLTGPDKVNILTRHYLTQYGRLPTADRHERASQAHQLQIGDFSFFYNAVQGRLSPIEQQVGVGVAGVCLTVIDRNMKPVFEVGYQEGDHDMEGIEKYFASFPNPGNMRPSKYHLMIEVWAQGTVNATALLDTICQSFRQNLCDDVIETSIAQGLCPSARDRRNDVDELDGEPLIGERTQRNFIDPSFVILQHAYRWKNPAVQSLSLQYTMPPWIMDSFLLELDEILIDVSVQFSPFLIRSMANRNRYKEYKASSGIRKSFGDMTNIRFILIGGIQDLGDGWSSNTYGRRTSMGSDRSHSRRSSLAEGQSVHHSHKTSTHSSQQHPRRQLEDIKMYPNAIVSTDQDEIMLTRNCFVVITANGFGLQVYTYNWSKLYHEFMFSTIEKVVRWHKDRMRLLDNILLQKMGLFYHVPSMLSAPPPPPTAPNMAQATPAITPSVIHNIPRVTGHGSPHIGSNLRIGHTEPGTPSVSRTTTSPKTQTTSTVVPDAASLSSLVEDQFPIRPRVSTSFHGNDDGRTELPKAPSTLSLVTRPNPPGPGAIPSHAHSHSHTQSQSHISAQIPTSDSAASILISPSVDVDQLLRDYSLDALETPRDEDQVQDEVQRHGKPFMDTFTYHSKKAEEQQNAFNVYQKWSRRYRDRKDSPNALHENMNTTDLAIMLRSSRLLHFCRTPLLFTEFSSSLFQLSKDSSCPNSAGVPCNVAEPPRPPDESSSTAPVVDPVVHWYSALAETFMREYSQYLASVGMQLLMYGNSKFDKPVPSHPGEISFMSQFTVSQTLSVPSPAAFLFKSLQGGSIMCEVRLQGMFVCVTLYTLNRRYGRIKVAAPGFDTAEANKQGLRAFTEQCARFKDRIHVNSFVYDFHLRYIHRILIESSKLSIPNSPDAGKGFTPAPTTSLPFSFDLIDVLHQFMQYHSRPAAYSRNRVYRGVYRTNVAPGESELPSHLFDYVIKNPQRYGFQAIHLHNQPRACFISGRDLLGGFRASHDSTGLDHLKTVSEIPSQGLKGFGVGANRGGLPPHSGKRSYSPHTRHTSHDSTLTTKRPGRRMTNSRSSYNVKGTTTTIEADGVEYVLVIAEGEQDCSGLTIHYYLLILREEGVVKRLEERHGPLVNAKDRLLVANHNLLVIRETGATGLINPIIGGVTNHPNVLSSPRQPLQSRSFGDREALEQTTSTTTLDPDSTKSEQSAQDASTRGERLMDATELQERITERAVLGDVVRAAEVRLDLLLKQAAQFFDRDSLWEMLLQGRIGNSNVAHTGSHSVSIAASLVTTPGTVPSTDAGDYMSHNSSSSIQGIRHDSNNVLAFADFLALGQRFHSTALEEMEPEFREIMMAPGIDWNEVLTFLARYYARWAREFMENEDANLPGSGEPGLMRPASGAFSRGRQGSLGSSLNPQKPRGARRHLVIFNPHNRDLLVHFVIDLNTPGSMDGSGEGGQGSLSPMPFSCMRTSTGDLRSRFRSNSTKAPSNSGNGSGSRPRLYSQSHSQLQTLLLSSSQPTSPQLPQISQPQEQSHRTSFSESSSRVSSMSSIARAATLAVSLVTGRLQPSRSRERSSTIVSQSDTSSRAPSVLVDDDAQSTTGTFMKGHLSKTGGGGGGGSSSFLTPDGNAYPTRKMSVASHSSSTRRFGETRSTRPRQSTVGSDRAFERPGDVETIASGVDEETGSDNPDRALSDVGKEDEEYGSRTRYHGENDEDGEEDGEEEDEQAEEDEDGDDGVNVRVFSVSREPKTGYNAEESEHVGDIIRTLSYWIWKANK